LDFACQPSLSLSIVVVLSLTRFVQLQSTAMMLKLKMSPRKKQKRSRSLPSPQSSVVWHDDDGSHDVEVAGGDKDKFADNVTAMLRQEESNSYACVDYLSMTAWHNNMYQLMGRQGNKSLHSPPEASRIDEYCREQICEWSYRVVDYFRIDREVTAVSLSYLDRFLCTCSCDRSMFKLAATTTLYMAVKVFHPQKLEDLGVLSDLSRGEFDMTDVAEMEQHILQALSWRLHPPTAVAMSSLLLDYFLADRLLAVSDDDITEIKDTASFFAELAVCDYFFTTLPPSTVALASILNSLEGVLTYESDATRQLLDDIGAINFPMDRQELSAACNRLWELYERSEECALHMDFSLKEEHATIYAGNYIKRDASMDTLSTASPISVNLPYKTTDYFPQRGVMALRNGSW
jgi:hypothetical protein